MPRSARRRTQPSLPAYVQIELLAVFVVAALVPLGLALAGGGAGLIERQQFAVVLWIVLLAGFLFGVLPRTRMQPGIAVPIGAVIGLAVWMTLGLVWTDSVERSLAELARLGGYVGIAGLALSCLHSGNWRAAAAGLFAGCSAICLLALASRLAPDLINWGPVASLGRERLNYPLEYWNALAFVAVATLLLGIGFGCFADRTLRPLALAMTPIAGLVLYLTLSRGGMLAAFVGGAVLVLLAPDRRTLVIPAVVWSLSTAGLILLVRSQPEIAESTGGGGGGLVALAVLLGAVACAAASSPRSPGRRRAADSGSPRSARAVAGLVLVTVIAVIAVIEEKDPRGAPGLRIDPATRLTSADSPRYELWRTAVGSFTDTPLSGSGAGTFQYQWDASGLGFDTVIDSHSLFLDALSEMGVLGFIGLVIALTSLGVLAVRARDSVPGRQDRAALGALIAVFVAFCAHAGLDWLWEVPATGVLGLGAVLIVIAASSSPRSMRRMGVYARGSLVIVCLAAIVVQIPGLVAEDRIEASFDASRAGQRGLAIELAGEAIDAAPWFSSGYARRAELELGPRRYDESRADAERAAELEPREWRHALLLARIALAARDDDGAIVALDRVAELRPASRPLILRLQAGIRSGDREVLDPFAG